MQELYTKLKSADGIILASPVYFFNVTAQAKTILDRTYALQPLGQPLRNKVAGIIACAGSTGILEAVKSVRTIFDLHGIFVVNWVGIYSPATERPKGLEAARNLGRDMVDVASQPIKLPENYSPNHITFGTHTH
jgi:multimeric flavodoxin WrbA